METTTQLFLGVRFVCAHCHDHPFEQWTNKQYFELSAFFAQVGVRDGARNLEKVVYDKGDGEIMLSQDGPRRAHALPLHATCHLRPTSGRRQMLAEWLTSKNNPYFAKAIVNRRLELLLRAAASSIRWMTSAPATRPCNPELLTALTNDFIDHQFRLAVPDPHHRQLADLSAYPRAQTSGMRTTRPILARAAAPADRRGADGRHQRRHRQPHGFKECPQDFTAEELPDPRWAWADSWTCSAGRSGKRPASASAAAR